ncbi:MAG: DEAD/DEAH box helicase family protein [Helicobacteraceae bacterium]|jgi:ATP-dependent DNA helicase RecG|nr:DEAD/DEAH box helicase family protein [Helicobacteraceae bacterium]
MNAIKIALNIPQKYRDTREKRDIILDEFAAIKVDVKATQNHPKHFVVKLFCPMWEVAIDAVYFNIKNWQKAQFIIGKSLILYGKISTAQNGLQIIQPIVVKNFGGITPIYKGKNITQNLKLDDLLQENLPPKIAEILHIIHFPKNKIPDLQSNEIIHALKFAEIFNFLRSLESRNTVKKALISINANEDDFIANLPPEIKLTKDQLSAIAAARADLAKPTQSRRMIVGDVGCGKTLVMIAIAAMAGKEKSILMAPTSILAEQLANEARKFLQNRLAITLVMQTSNASDSEIADADFLIGTHALLYRKLPRAACVMIDEQHRFGAAQRQLLSKLTAYDPPELLPNESGESGENPENAAIASGESAENLQENSEQSAIKIAKDSPRPHFFQFSATPIPRTLAMIQSKMIAISAIRTMPFTRRTETKVVRRADFKPLLAHIRAEISRGNQILIIYPLIKASEKSEYQSLEEAAPYWQSRFEGVVVTHGQDRDKEAALLAFRKRGAILLATTVVEVGISLPRLSTIVIVGAERLGLATLHQLRGRVGRLGQESWCFFYTNREKSERLERLAETSDGWEVAELDLQTRESGDLLEGAIQSGANFRFFNPATDQTILKEAGF